MKLSLPGISPDTQPQTPILIEVWGKTETQNGSRKAKERMNRDGKCGAIQKTARALQGNGLFWAESPEEVGHSGADQSTRPVTDQLPHPGPTPFLALHQAAPFLWFARPTEPGQETLAGTSLLFTAQNRQETKASLHRTWCGMARVGALVEKEMEELGRGGSGPASRCWNKGRELGGHTSTALAWGAVLKECRALGYPSSWWVSKFLMSEAETETSRRVAADTGVGPAGKQLQRCSTVKNSASRLCQ